MLLNLLRNAGSLSWWLVLAMLISYAALVFLMLPLHECAHGLAAYWLGDRTAKWQGRLTLNPLRHLDPVGTILLVLFGFGYARPVPINPYNFRKVRPKTGMALTALAGPLSNLLMAWLSLLIFRLRVLLSGGMVAEDAIYYREAVPCWMELLYPIFVEVFAGINIGLAVFNLLPIHPLDGSRIFGAFLPDKWLWTLERYSRYFTWILMALLLTDVLDRPLALLRHSIGGLLCLLSGLPNLF